MKKFIVTVLFVLIFFGFFIYKDFKSRCDFFYNPIIGRVSEMKFTRQKTLSVKIDNSLEWIYLGTNINYNINIEIGDSLLKKKNNFEIILLKNKELYNITSKRKFEKWSKYCGCK
jgi:hypothetical protein